MGEWGENAGVTAECTKKAASGGGWGRGSGLKKRWRGWSREKARGGETKQNSEVLPKNTIEWVPPKSA